MLIVIRAPPVDADIRMIRPFSSIVELGPREMLIDIAVVMLGGAVSGKCGATIETSNYRRRPG